MWSYYPTRFIYQHRESPRSTEDDDITTPENIPLPDFEILPLQDVMPNDPINVLGKDMVDYQAYKKWRESHPIHTRFKTAEEAYPQDIRISNTAMQQLESISIDNMPQNCDPDMEKYYDQLLYMDNKRGFISLAEKNYYVEGQSLNDIEHTKVLFINDTHSNQEIKHVLSSLVVLGFDPKNDILLAEGLPMGTQVLENALVLWPHGTKLLVPEQTEGWEIESAQKKTREEQQMFGIPTHEKKDSFMHYINTVIEKMQKDSASQEVLDHAIERRDFVKSREPGSSDYVDPHKEYEGMVRDRNIGIFRSLEQHAKCGRIWVFCGSAHTDDYFKDCMPKNVTYLYPKEMCTFQELHEMNQEWEESEKFLKTNDK
ncbi:MAG: hypothetical protein AAF843_12795 [Bacteroidota bacterium]